MEVNGGRRKRGWVFCTCHAQLPLETINMLHNCNESNECAYICTYIHTYPTQTEVQLQMATNIACVVFFSEMSNEWNSVVFSVYSHTHIHTHTLAIWSKRESLHDMRSVVCVYTICLLFALQLANKPIAQFFKAFQSTNLHWWSAHHKRLIFHV